MALDTPRPDAAANLSVVAGLILNRDLVTELDGWRVAEHLQHGGGLILPRVARTVVNVENNKVDALVCTLLISAPLARSQTWIVFPDPRSDAERAVTSRRPSGWNASQYTE